ncbi:hypothetical protein JCM17960_30840 [Magnetospira thiophila]
MTTPHCALATESVRKESGKILSALRAKGTKDARGRIDESAVAVEMKIWWTAQGYRYP